MGFPNLKRIESKISRYLTQIFKVEFANNLCARNIVIVDVVMKGATAQVFYHILPGAFTQKETDYFLHRNCKKITYHLAHFLLMKNIPLIRFYYDNSLHEGNKIEAILKRIKKNKIR